MTERKLFLIEAAGILSRATRGELTDSAFGDAEVWWKDSAGKVIAEGYFGSSTQSVSFDATSPDPNRRWYEEGYEAISFKGEKAERLRLLGRFLEYQSNNSGVAMIRDSEETPWRSDPRYAE